LALGLIGSTTPVLSNFTFTDIVGSLLSKFSNALCHRCRGHTHCQRHGPSCTLANEPCREVTGANSPRQGQDVHQGELIIRTIAVAVAVAVASFSLALAVVICSAIVWLTENEDAERSLLQRMFAGVLRKSSDTTCRLPPATTTL
jgi:hypothetical protein